MKNLSLIVLAMTVQAAAAQAQVPTLTDPEAPRMLLLGLVTGGVLLVLPHAGRWLRDRRR